MEWLGRLPEPNEESKAPHPNRNKQPKEAASGSGPPVVPARQQEAASGSADLGPDPWAQPKLEAPLQVQRPSCEAPPEALHIMGSALEEASPPPEPKHQVPPPLPGGGPVMAMYASMLDAERLDAAVPPPPPPKSPPAPHSWAQAQPAQVQPQPAQVQPKAKVQPWVEYVQSLDPKWAAWWDPSQFPEDENAPGRKVARLWQMGNFKEIYHEDFRSPLCFRYRWVLRCQGCERRAMTNFGHEVPMPEGWSTSKKHCPECMGQAAPNASQPPPPPEPWSNPWMPAPNAAQPPPPEPRPNMWVAGAAMPKAAGPPLALENLQEAAIPLPAADQPQPTPHQGTPAQPPPGVDPVVFQLASQPLPKRSPLPPKRQTWAIPEQPP